MIIIVGNTEYSILLMKYINESGKKIDAFCVNECFIEKKNLCGKPVLPIEKIKDYCRADSAVLYMGIGYSNLGEVRKNLFNDMKNKGYSFENYIHPSAQINPEVNLGEGNVIFENVVVQKNTIIGDANLFFSNSSIMHDDRIGCFNTFCAGSVCNGFTSVGNCNFIGANAVLRDKISMGNKNIVGAGIFLNKNLENNKMVKIAKSIVIKESDDVKI